MSSVSKWIPTSACPKHASEGDRLTDPDLCPHCKEEAKIVEERIGRVVKAVYSIAGKGAAAGPDTDLHAALRDLIREARR